MNNNIFLIGFMGSGKSTVGHILAKKLGYTFVDTDSMVEESCNMLIKDMFDQYGEKYFRSKEYEALEKVLCGKNQVISTGGGIVTFENSQRLLGGQDVYYISITPETVYKRLEKDTTRPLLKDISFEKIETLLSGRKSLYEKSCVQKIDGDQAPEKVAEDIAFHISVTSYNYYKY
jgi:shikimate kinase